MDWWYVRRESPTEIYETKHRTRRAALRKLDWLMGHQARGRRLRISIDFGPLRETEHRMFSTTRRRRVRVRPQPTAFTAVPLPT